MADPPTWYDEGLRFTCTQCGNCCSGPPGYVWFTPQELADMAAHFNLDPEAFLEKFARRLRGKWSLKEVSTSHGMDCVFLRRDPRTGKAMCSIYAVRPGQCRTWPFWPENLRTVRHFIAAAEICPGIRKGLEGEGTFYPIDKIRIMRDATRM
jgi:hypothetical protein